MEYCYIASNLLNTSFLKLAHFFLPEKRGKILLSEIDSGLFSHSVLQYITTTVNDDGSKVEAVEVDRSMFLWLHYYERLLIFKGRTT